jgi:hypothetical protein
MALGLLPSRDRLLDQLIQTPQPQVYRLRPWRFSQEVRRIQYA